VKTPEIDQRKKQDIVTYIERIAAAYTPEWRFDAENPDVGTALALIYADMFAGTIQRLNQVPEKNKVAFFNGINAKLLPAIPAAGYVTFGLAGEPAVGVAVKAGTQLVADVEDPEAGSQIFETVNDVYVTPARPEQIYGVSGQQDVIRRIYDRGEFGLNPEPFYLFDFNGPNLQEHVLYFCQNGALSVRNGAWVEIAFYPHYQNRVSEEILQGFLDEKTAGWEYCATEGYLPFDGAKVQDGKLLFFKSERQPPFALTEQHGVENYWIRCTVKDIRLFQEFYLDKIEITSQGTRILPDAVSGAGVEENIYECFPFGEKMSLYGDVYFASEEALSKKGALVSLSFNLNFIRIPIDLDLGDPNINWKIIMRRSDFKPDVEYDITIEDVIWEYYNGQGWARLFPTNEYRDVFSTKYGTMGQYRSIDFVCPQDMARILVNSCESYFIRCRILKLNNLYKMKGYYISPLIEGPSFAYEYTRGAVLPDYLYTVNNLREEVYTAGDLKDEGAFFRPFQNIGENRATLYLGLAIPPQEGPIKLLFSLQEAIAEKPPRLVWEYYGAQGWSPLNIVDETEHMRKTGIVTFMGSKDFQKKTLWSRDLYWIRVLDGEGRYDDRKNPLQLPRVKGLYMNATQVFHLETRTEELFSITPQEEDFSCKLLYPNVQAIEVWVNEVDLGEPPAWKEWEKKEQLRLVRDAEGHVQEAWVRWEEVEDFALSGPEDRHYIVEKNQGAVSFGNGKNGRIPPSREGDSIRIEYRTGGGKIGNLPMGQINKSILSLGFINNIGNPEITSGGCDQETVQEALRRSAAALKHGYRGVTARDYEALALEATRNIWKAKCFANYNEQGQREPGSVTLVILQKDFQHGRAFFNNLKEQVFQYISERISGNIVDLNRFYVAEPQFLELAVKVELAVKDFNQVFQVKEQVEKRLAAFIHPMTGNFDGHGWEIGVIPNRTQILNSLKDVGGISFLKNVSVSAYAEGRFGRVEADLERGGERIFALPLSGDHEIVITVEERR
jgi:hypothetical protein